MNAFIELVLKVRYKLHKGKQQYCIDCLPAWNTYIYWKVNTMRARLIPKAGCAIHGNKEAHKPG